MKYLTKLVFRFITIISCHLTFCLLSPFWLIGCLTKQKYFINILDKIIKFENKILEKYKL